MNFNATTSSVINDIYATANVNGIKVGMNKGHDETVTRDNEHLSDNQTQPISPAALQPKRIKAKRVVTQFEDTNKVQRRIALDKTLKHLRALNGGSIRLLFRRDVDEMCNALVNVLNVYKETANKIHEEMVDMARKGVQVVDNNLLVDFNNTHDYLTNWLVSLLTLSYEILSELFEIKNKISMGKWAGAVKVLKTRGDGSMHQALDALFREIKWFSSDSALSEKASKSLREDFAVLFECKCRIDLLIDSHQSDIITTLAMRYYPDITKEMCDAADDELNTAWDNYRDEKRKFEQEYGDK